MSIKRYKILIHFHCFAVVCLYSKCPIQLPIQALSTIQEPVSGYYFHIQKYSDSLLQILMVDSLGCNHTGASFLVQRSDSKAYAL